MSNLIPVTTPKIVKGYPPNYAEIAKRFPSVRGRQGVLFTYGDVIYNPSGGEVPIWLVAHEHVHVHQQHRHLLTRQLNPVIWWHLYITNNEFRFEQELEAHKVELVEYANHERSQHRRERYLDRVASRLASPLYDFKFLSKSVAIDYLLGAST